MLQPSGASGIGPLHTFLNSYVTRPIQFRIVWMNGIEREECTESNSNSSSKKTKKKINLLMNMEMYLLNHLILITFIVSLLICRNKNMPETRWKWQTETKRREEKKIRRTQHWCGPWDRRVRRQQRRRLHIRTPNAIDCAHISMQVSGAAPDTDTQPTQTHTRTMLQTNNLSWSLIISYWVI